MIYDIAIVGGGIVGLASARALLSCRPHLKLIVIEKEPAVGRHQSGHNSGVIHSGIYYTPGSLKARLCVEGRKAALDYCEAKGIEYRLAGKLIVATAESEVPRLNDLMRRGVANGIDGLELIDTPEIHKRAPAFTGLKAIWSPATGIVDWSTVTRSFADDVRAAGGAIYTGREVTGFTRRNGVTNIATPEGDLEARNVITCGGLFSDRLARMTGGSEAPRIVPFRGDYLVLRPEKRELVQTNVYPVPDPEFPFLGMHFTPRMNGDVWFGPNAVPAFAREGYSFAAINPRDLLDSLSFSGVRKMVAKYWKTGLREMYRDLVPAAYVEALQRYMPDLRVEDCMPGPSGVRAQAMNADGTMSDDFIFEAAEGVLHVRNSPSPGATSSLAIGRHIAEDAERRFGF